MVAVLTFLTGGSSGGKTGIMGAAVVGVVVGMVVGVWSRVGSVGSGDIGFFCNSDTPKIESATAIMETAATIRYFPPLLLFPIFTPLTLCFLTFYIESRRK